MTAVLLVNLGTPLSPHPRDVKQYLTEFLTDPRVIDFPWLKRQLLVRGVIIPKRYRDSANAYSRIWEKEGSPLLLWGRKLRTDLQKQLGKNFTVKLAMRYQFPSISQAVLELEGYRRVVILPLFPQFASATTGSVIEKCLKEFSKLQTLPRISIISSFPKLPKMIEAFKERAKKMPIEAYDRILFSFHGLPLSQSLKQPYEEECRETASAIIDRMKIPKEKAVISFQSRLGKEPWIEPYTQDVIHAFAKDGMKRLLVFSPSFVCDCLETTDELGFEYRREFVELGGETLDLVPGLNDHPLWIQGLSDLVHHHLQS